MGVFLNNDYLCIFLISVMAVIFIHDASDVMIAVVAVSVHDTSYPVTAWAVIVHDTSNVMIAVVVVSVHDASDIFVSFSVSIIHYINLPSILYNIEKRPDLLL